MVTFVTISDFPFADFELLKSATVLYVDCYCFEAYFTGPRDSPDRILFQVAGIGSWTDLDFSISQNIFSHFMSTVNNDVFLWSEWLMD